MLPALLVACVLAQEEWAPMPGAPSEPPPPPPPPPVTAPIAPVPAPAPVTPPATEIEEPGFRFAPTLNVLLISEGLTARTEQLFPSVRAGLRWAAFPRPAERYQVNLGVALQGGLEGTTLLNRDTRYGFGITARGGLNIVSPRGLFFPFLDLYALSTLAIIPLQGGGVALSPRFGVGLNLNAAAIPTGGRGSWGNFNLGSGGGGGLAIALLVVLFILLPNLELVWVPPSPLNSASSVEVRVGIGF